MKSFINITEFVSVAEPANEEHGITISIDNAGLVSLTPQFYDNEHHGTFDEAKLRAAICRVATAFENAKKALEE